jgi:hypothetical protein
MKLAVHLVIGKAMRLETVPSLETDGCRPFPIPRQEVPLNIKEGHATRTHDIAADHEVRAVSEN